MLTVQARPPSEQFQLNHSSPQALGLVGWWPTSDYAGGAVLRDRSGAGYRGTADSLWATPRINSPLVGLALNCPGTTSYVDCGDILRLGSSLTLSAWVYLTSAFAAGYQAIVGKWNDSHAAPGRNYLLCFGSAAAGKDGLTLFSHDLIVAGTTRAVLSTVNQAFFVGRWTLCTGVVDCAASQVLLYVDGVYNNAAAGNATSNIDCARGFYIGAHTSAGTSLSGRIADVRVYNRALTSSEIMALYQPSTRWELYAKTNRRAFRRPNVADSGELSLGREHQATGTGLATALASASAGRTHTATGAGLATALGSVTGARALGVSEGGLATGVAAATLGRTERVTAKGTATMYKAVVLNIVLGTGQFGAMSMHLERAILVRAILEGDITITCPLR